LTEFLARNPLREQYGAGVRVAVHGRYLIFYAAGDDHTVVIERILHGSRHLERRISQIESGGIPVGGIS
jgi:plasmid stabilization system protein ParE